MLSDNCHCTLLPVQQRVHRPDRRRSNMLLRDGEQPQFEVDDVPVAHTRPDSASVVRSGGNLRVGPG